MGKNGGMMAKRIILTDKEVAGAGGFYKQNQDLVEDEFEVWSGMPRFI